MDLLSYANDLEAQADQLVSQIQMNHFQMSHFITREDIGSSLESDIIHSMYQSESCQLTLGGQSLEHFETLYGRLPSSVEGHRHCIHEVKTHIYRMCGAAVCVCA